MLHHNFCGYAISDLETITESFELKGWVKSAKINKILIQLLKKSQKFTIPIGGRLMDMKNFDATYREMIRLPYDVVAVEYEQVIEKTSDIGPSVCTKRIALAFNTHVLGDDINLFFEDGKEKFPTSGIIVWPISYYNDSKIWVPVWCGILIPEPVKFIECDQIPPDAISNVEKIMTIANDQHVGIETAILSMGELTRSVVLSFIEKGTDILTAEILDTGDEVSAVMSMCCALNCKNVIVERAKPASRKATEKKKPKMYFEYKYLLVDTSKSVEYPKSESTVTKRASPIGHLRRGHLRRYANGNTKWINDIEVNYDNGFLAKDYTIK